MTAPDDEQGDLPYYLAGADGAAPRRFTEPPGMDEPSFSLADLIKMYEHGRRIEREKNRALYRGLDPEVAVLAARLEAKARGQEPPAELAPIGANSPTGPRRRACHLRLIRP